MLGHRDTADLEREIENMFILRPLQHPNIIELIAASLYAEKYNLLMPQTTDGNLKDILSGRCPSPWRSEAVALATLCGLGSAVSSMHDFVRESIDFRAIAHHHTLKPANVHVDGSKLKLMLTDFGLIRVEQLPSDSAPSIELRQGDYCPRKCDLLEDPGQGFVYQSSDVWSLGCILAEMLTFLLKGPDGVQYFQERRGCTILSKVTWRRFHKGQNEANSGVTEWLTELDQSIRCDKEQKLELPRQLLASLVKDMLCLKPDKHLKAGVVDTRLRIIALSAMAFSVDQQLGRVSEHDQEYNVTEHRGFSSWMAACGLEKSGSQIKTMADTWTGVPSHRFQVLLDKLDQLDEALVLCEKQPQNPGSSIFLRFLMQKGIDDLLEMLPFINDE
jgi:serine/threonine protein kinase